MVAGRASEPGLRTIADLHICIALFYRAPMGGLHENVRETARRLCTNGARVTVVCSGGPLATALRKMGVQVLETDYGLINGLVEEAVKLGPFDFVHVHPGPSREFGLRLARVANIPTFITLHGEWLDSIHMFWDRFVRIFAVSGAVHARALNAAPEAQGLIQAMPNGVNLERLPAAKRTAQPKPWRCPHVIVASRFDADKQCVVDYLIELWQAQTDELAFHWEIAGTGTEIGKLEQAADRLNRAHNANLVRFHGWLETPALYQLYDACDFSVSPGRSAMESMAMWLPTVALGSQGCFGLITPARVDQAAYSNFGGAGLSVQASPASVIEEMAQLWRNSADYLDIAKQMNSYICSNFDARYWHCKLETTYLSVLNSAPQFPSLPN